MAKAKIVQPAPARREVPKPAPPVVVKSNIELAVNAVSITGCKLTAVTLDGRTVTLTLTPSAAEALAYSWRH